MYSTVSGPLERQTWGMADLIATDQTWRLIFWALAAVNACLASLIVSNDRPGVGALALLVVAVAGLLGTFVAPTSRWLSADLAWVVICAALIVDQGNGHFSMS